MRTYLNILLLNFFAPPHRRHPTKKSQLSNESILIEKCIYFSIKNTSESGFSNVHILLHFVINAHILLYFVTNCHKTVDFLLFCDIF